MDVGGNAQIYVVGPRIYQFTDPIDASEVTSGKPVSRTTQVWPTTNSASVEIAEVTPFDVTLSRPGPSWVFVAVITEDEFGEELGFHGLWQNRHGAERHHVRCCHSKCGRVWNTWSRRRPTWTDWLRPRLAQLTTLRQMWTRRSRHESDLRSRCPYTEAGRYLRTAGRLPSCRVMGDASESVEVESPSSSALLEEFAERYTGAIEASGLTDMLAAKEALIPTDVEDLVLGLAQSASAEYVSLAASWSALQERVSTTAKPSPLRRRSPCTLTSPTRRRVVSPAVAGRSGCGGSSGRRVGLGGCRRPGNERRTRISRQPVAVPGKGCARSWRRLGTTDFDAMRQVRRRNARGAAGLRLGRGTRYFARWQAQTTTTPCFLEGLGIAESSEILQMFGYEQPSVTPIAPPPHRLRIIARLDEDGRIEHGVELSDGEQMLPSSRYLSSDASPGMWQVSSDVEVDGDPIGRIRTRWLDDGRVELGFMDAVGGTITPDIRYLSADIPAGVWLRSGEIEVTRQPVLE